MEGYVFAKFKTVSEYVPSRFSIEFKDFSFSGFVVVCLFVVVFPAEKLEYFIENEPWKQKDMWIGIFHEILNTLIHFITQFIKS